MKIEEKIEEMNKATGGTLSITYYAEWELVSYGRNTLFAVEDVIKAESFKKLIEKAYKSFKDRRMDERI